MCGLRLILLWVLVVFLSASAPVSMADTVYSVTEPELTRLTEIMKQLEALNQQLSNDLQTSKTDLATLQARLKIYRTELETLSSRLTQLQSESITLREQLDQAQNLLAKARQSYVQYEQEVQTKIKWLKWQRNVSVVVMILSLMLTGFFFGK